MTLFFDKGYNKGVEKARQIDLNSESPEKMMLKVFKEIDSFDHFVHRTYLQPKFLIAAYVILGIITLGFGFLFGCPLLAAPIVSPYLKGQSAGYRDQFIKIFTMKGVEIPREYKYGVNDPKRPPFFLG